MKTKIKALISMFCIMLIVSVPLFGTMAWLSDTTDELENTFTAAKIDIGLTESEGLDLKMVPGKELAKDPKVTVAANSEACWLFVKAEKSANFANFFDTAKLAYATGWTKLTSACTDTADVLYRQVASEAEAQEFYVLADADPATAEFGANGSVVVLGTVTGEQLAAITAGTEPAPTFTFTSYAIQQAGFDSASAAWAALTSTAK